MNPQRIAGIALLIIGAILIVVGLSSSDSFADQVSETFTGRFTDRTMWYILGGAGVAVVGVLLLVVRRGK